MKLRAPLSCLTATLAVTALGLGGLVPAAAAPEPSSSSAEPAVGAVLETAPPAPSQALAIEAADRAADQPLGPFYAAPSQLPDSPASLLKHEPSPFYLGPARAVRLGEAQSRIMYTTTDSDGAIVPVTGSFLESGSPWRGSGARPLITYAVGTQGVADQCAPSHQGTQGTEYEAAAINALLLAGYDVVMTDYIGLGMQGPHTYMDRLDQGHAALDAARAAGLGGTSAQTPVGIVGYSQGGGAAASAGELAASYAPELKVRAIAAGAVPADLHQVAAQIDSGLYNGFLMYALSGLIESEGISPASFLNPRGVQLYTETVGECTTSAIAPTALIPTISLTASGRPLAEVAGTEPFRSILDEQRLGGLRGSQRTRADRPQGLRRRHSLPDGARAGRWCAQGASVQLAPTLDAGHVGGYVTSQPHILSFLQARFDGRAPVATCARL